jgi:hypothetical protein
MSDAFAPAPSAHSPVTGHEKTKFLIAGNVSIESVIPSPDPNI